MRSKNEWEEELFVECRMRTDPEGGMGLGDSVELPKGGKGEGAEWESRNETMKDDWWSIFVAEWEKTEDSGYGTFLSLCVCVI